MKIYCECWQTEIEFPISVPNYSPPPGFYLAGSLETGEIWEGVPRQIANVVLEALVGHIIDTPFVIGEGI